MTAHPKRAAPSRSRAQLGDHSPRARTRPMAPKGGTRSEDTAKSRRDAQQQKRKIIFVMPHNTEVPMNAQRATVVDDPLTLPEVLRHLCSGQPANTGLFGAIMRAAANSKPPPPLPCERAEPAVGQVPNSGGQGSPATPLPTTPTTTTSHPDDTLPLPTATSHTQTTPASPPSTPSQAPLTRTPRRRRTRHSIQKSSRVTRSRKYI